MENTLAQPSPTVAVKPMGFTQLGEGGQGLAEPSVLNSRLPGHLLGTLC